MNNRVWELPSLHLESFNLKNNLRVVCVPRPYSFFHFFRLSLNYGEKYESISEISHVLEHVLFDSRINELDFLKMGGDIGGFVSFDSFDIFWVVYFKFANESFDIIRKILEFPSNFSDRNLRSVIESIKIELLEKFSSPEFLTDVIIRRFLYGENHWTLSLDEIFKILDSMSIGDIKSEFEYLSPNGSVLSSVLGRGEQKPTEASRVNDLNIDLSKFEDWCAGSRIPIQKVIHLQHYEPGIYTFEELPRGVLSIGFPGSELSKVDAFILGGFGDSITIFSGDLFAPLRKEGLIYSIDFNNFSYSTYGYVQIFLRFNPSKEREVLDRIIKIFDNIIHFTDSSLFEKIKVSILSNSYSIHESKKSLTSVLNTFYLLKKDETYFFNKILPEIARMIPEKIQKIIKKHVSPDKFIILLPKSA